ncbi:prepilin-type N-terminal cleavage/methylation domain-containing protein [Curtobacterium sp. PhB130]|uniref:prepilin-type N-terminal cleavage/methylation domain-containing protein n=1 Tax=unclassified Curtobacterium TaxID=257496 RepID=UPI000F9443AE|nr:MULTISPECIES: prepilin-type N-terminal cleavage/methylation domain-containing protein [unclassified Curtobacterium]ROS77557.1 prepilin-type N-terminal cleavage/methylation domain-containing protein [Curtobacterium sp. PhB130]TCK66236.1 prepilin-type N-terminal cleavage/methylation domain-containing protein [Curtobacterium sp. PhB136]
MRALRRRLDVARRDERGLTLVELLVAMTLSLIVLTVAGSFLISSQKASNTASSVSTNTRVASNAMNEIGRMLRAATDNPVPTGDDSQYAFQYASTNSVRFFAYVNLDSTLSQAVEVQLTLDPVAKTITEKKWVGTAVSGNSSYYSFPLNSGATLSTTPTSTRTLASPAVNSAMFVFRDGSNGVLGSPTTPVAAADLPNIRSVDVAVTVGKSTSDASAVTLSNTTSMPNIVMGAP